MTSFLKIHCHNEWSVHICDIGNICSLFADLIGFSSLLPQIYQTWNYKSVEAMPVLWPTALFTASLANTFYIFATEKRAFFKISAVYFPIVYMLFLSEFWFYTKKNPIKKLSYAAVCVIFWACLLTIELTVSFPDGSKKLEWITVVVFSINIIPQLVTNIMIRTTIGQSSIAVLLQCIVASFFYLSVFLLETDLEYKAMHYVATSLAYVNGIQVLWYPTPVFEDVKQPTYVTLVDSKDYSVPFEERHIVVGETVQQESVELSARDSGNHSKSYSSKETSYTSSLARSQTINIVSYYERCREKSWWQMMLLVYLFVGLILLTIGLGMTTNKLAAAVGPLSMFGFLFLTSLYRDYKEGSLNCYFLSELRYRLF